MRCFKVDEIDKLSVALAELAEYAETHTKDDRVVKVYPPDVVAIDYIDEMSVVRIKVSTKAVKAYEYATCNTRVKLTYVAYFDAADYDDIYSAICDITDDFAEWLDNKCMGTKR